FGTDSYSPSPLRGGGWGEGSSGPLAPDTPRTTRLILIVVLLVVIILVLVVVPLVVPVVLGIASLGCGDLGGQVARPLRPQQAFLLLHHAVLPVLVQHVVHQEHAVGPAGLDARVDAIRLVLTDQVGDGRRHHHHLVAGDHSLRLLGQQALRQHANQRRRK